jgi:hypothetical protein
MIVLGTILVLFLSCATAPKAPDWILTTPQPDGTNTYFVGSAPGRDMGTATAEATNNLIAGIMQYMGVSVKVNTSATAQASLSAYSADIRQTVETQSTNRISGFKVLQKFAQQDKGSGQYTVYILASYATSDLRKEKARIEALFQEKIDAVAKPEAEGDALAGSNRILEAVGKYIEAMVAASGSDIENANLKVERNANKARQQLSLLSLSLGGLTEIKGSMGRVPEKSLDIQVLGARGGQRFFVPGASLLITYPRRLANGRIGTKSESLVSDASGWVRATLPVPDFVGKSRINIQLDLSSTFELFDKVGRSYSAYVSSIEDELRSKAIDLPYTVSSQAAGIPMTFFVVDLDEKGAASSQFALQTGLMDTLSKEGFSLMSLPLDPGFALASKEVILQNARMLKGPGAGRLVIGTGKVDSVRSEGTLFVASASASIQVIDLASGKVLYAADKTWQALAADQSAARRNALRELGSQVFGKDIVSSLP